MENEKPQEDIAKKIMTKSEFYFDTPLYQSVRLDEIEKDFMASNAEVDGYNTADGFDTTYSIEANDFGYHDNDFRGFHGIILTCKRRNSNKLRFFLMNDGGSVTKVGQHPSLADLQFEEIGKKYNKVLDETALFEFKRAIGLAAHGTGIGSFVYLRRIFENLIFQTFDNNLSSLTVGRKDFEAMRMEERIDVLKMHLPSQLVEMKSIYSILSRGIHQLGEQECLTYFEPLKLSIALILDQKIEIDLKRQRDEAVKRQIQNIHSQLHQGLPKSP